MKARRENGNIVIEISEDALVQNGEQHPETPYRVIDREKFLNHVADRVCDIGESGDFNGHSLMTGVLDACAEEAVMNVQGAELIEDEEERPASGAGEQMTMKTRKTNSEPLPARDGSVMSDRQLLNWISGQLNARKGAQLRLTIQDNRDMGYKKNRITLFGGVGSKDITGKGDTVRKALTAMIRASSQNNKVTNPTT